MFKVHWVSKITSFFSVEFALLSRECKAVGRQTFSFYLLQFID